MNLPMMPVPTTMLSEPAVAVASRLLDWKAAWKAMTSGLMKPTNWWKSSQRRMVETPLRSTVAMNDRQDDRTSDELRELTMHEDERDHPGEPSPYSCPECGGVLWELKDGEMIRFRCRVGHAYTSDTLTTEQALTIEHALWSALRALEEQAAVRRRMADRSHRLGNLATAERYAERARELDAQAQEVRNLVLAGVGAADEESTPQEPAPKTG